MKLILFLLLLIPELSFAQNGVLFNDVSRLNPVVVHKIVSVHKLKDIQEAFALAHAEGLKISMAGKRHSQGGQQSYPNGIVLDMLEFKKIIILDITHKILRVQPGVTWEQIQDFIQPYGYAMRVMQASNIFTVGGALSTNIHGNDPNYGSIIETVKSFHLMLADGTIVNVSRKENPELFKLVIGGYGLLGVIVDVDLMLTDDVIYEMKSVVMDYKQYPEFLKKNILGNVQIGLHSAKLSNAPDSLLKEVVATTYTKTDKKDKDLFKLQQEGDIERNRILFGLSRKSGWGKDLRWFLQKRLIAKVGQTEYISRNNAMRPIIKFLDYYSPKDTDILQEYFVPIDRYVSFVDGLREIVKKENINLLSVTLRYAPRDNQSFLPYAKTDSVAVVLYINQKLSEKEIIKAKEWTGQIIDLSLSVGGTYYLPYQLYATKEQLLKAYPSFNEFVLRKNKYDPNGLFMNQLYEHYRQ